MGVNALGHDAGGAQGVPAMDQKNFRAEPGKIQSFLAGGIAAAHDDERLVAKNGQRAVARGTIGHAFGFQFVFPGDAEVFMTGAGGDDDGFGLERFAVHHQLKRRFGKINFFNRAETGFGAETLGLFLHSRHQFTAVHALGKAGKIFDDAGGGQQAAGLRAHEHERLEVGARGVEGRRPTGATGTNNHNFLHKQAARMKFLDDGFKIY